MKLPDFLHSALAQYLFLLSLCALITSTKSKIDYFKYTENTTDSRQPMVVNIQTYHDGTALVHITRFDPSLNESCSKSFGVFGNYTSGLEQRLRIRVIHLNGTVKEINPDLELNSLNYCAIRTFIPINIYPLQKEFILVTYINTTNASDITTYEEWGMVIDWEGNNLSKEFFGFSYIDNGLYWSPISKIQININPEFGFLRFAVDRNGDLLWQQYSIADNGALSYLIGDKFKYGSGFNILTDSLDTVATVDGGYAIVYTYSNNSNDDNLLLLRVGVNVIFIPYNQNLIRETVLYQINQPNVTIFGITCDTIDTLTFGSTHVCTISLMDTTESYPYYYVKINFLLSGAVLSSDILTTLPNITNTNNTKKIKPDGSWYVKSMPSGSYILYGSNITNSSQYIFAYDENNKQVFYEILGPFQTEYNFGANAFMNNNTALFSTTNTSDKNSSWSLATILFPSVIADHGYENVLINTTTPAINSTVDLDTTTLNITFFKAVALSTGNITVYKTSNNSIRQRISATMNNYIKISPDRKTISINVINSTFNQYNEGYYVEMDNNFVKYALYDEPLKGIESRIWILNSNNSKYRAPPSETATMGLALLTVEASKKFKPLSRNDKSKYFKTLLDDIADKIPVRRERLRSDEKFQLSDESNQIAISILIGPSIDGTGITVPVVFSNLDTMIRNKGITAFSSDKTNDLDEKFGFKPKRKEFKEWIIHHNALVVIFTILAVTDYEYLSILKDIPRFNEVAIDYKYLTIMKDVPKPKKVEPESNQDEPECNKNEPEFNKHTHEFNEIEAESNKVATDYKYLTVLKDAPRSVEEIPNEIKQINIFRQIFRFPIIYGAFFDIFVRNIPQIIIQYKLSLQSQFLLNVTLMLTNYVPSIGAIKEFQRKAKEYDEIIEWIPYDDLEKPKIIKWVPINEKEQKSKEQEIKEKLYLSMATWKKGIRTIEIKSERYLRSRTKSRVDLIKLHNSQTNSFVVIKKLERMMNEKHKIYGVTQDDKTKQYMIVLDYYYNKRNNDYEKCEQCGRYNTQPVWCQSCDPSNEIEITENKILNKTLSGNDKIDICIREFQLKATAYDKVIEWIPFEKLSNIDEIGRGGFGTVYTAIWLDGKRTVEKIDDCYKRSRRMPYVVVLKTFPGSRADASSFLKEFKNHMSCRLEGTELEMFGLTQNNESKDYLMVIQYANKGNLRKFLRENFSELSWQKKLEQLRNISHDLHLIHEAGFTHCDFHSGNILLNQNLDGKIKSYIADLGLSKQKGDFSKGELYGVVQYVAPEVLSGDQPFTQKADIYGFGIVMAEITGKKPFGGHEVDTKLAVRICKGLRPDFAPGTPDCYKELAKQCMDSNPQNRPNAWKIHEKISGWLRNLVSDKENEIKKLFLKSDETIKKLSITPQKHSDLIFSKRINQQKILKELSEKS
ncbi:hypothetical protein C2G38_2171062 [Gigaspora rosea]|uniref:Protein kinase domain-containing protein n=1 Tax=Gigaspora rosea TaxID=44941 RepID=A0A397VM07_9GLOM|nr:hypothetical protein C2G38_2171062 [Gigaspora rosea]